MKKLVIGFMSLLSIAAMAKEGGNGGGAFVCRNTNGQILSAELVDFFEGKTEYKLTIQKSKSPVEDQVNRAVVKYISASPEDSADFMESIRNVQEIMNVVPNAKLENTNDFNLRVAPKTCIGGTVKFEQLANYTDDNRLTVDEEIYTVLSNTDKAGLVIHEAAYLLSRQWHDSISSREARRLTAFLFSSTLAKEIDVNVLSMNLIDPNSNRKWVCSSLATRSIYLSKHAASAIPARDTVCRGIDWPACLILSGTQKDVLTAYGSNLEKAVQNLTDKQTEWKEFRDQYDYGNDGNNTVYTRFCGADSSVNFTDILKSWNGDGTINCSKEWSRNFDCKQI